MGAEHQATEAAKSAAAPQEASQTGEVEGAATTRGSATPLADLPPDLRRGRILALQGVVGNHAVQRMLKEKSGPGSRPASPTPPAEQAAKPRSGAPLSVQRNSPPPAAQPSQATPTTGLDASMLTFTGGDLQKAGSVTAGPDGNNVRVESPLVTYQAHVTLRSDVTLGDGKQIEVGPIQAVLGADRIGVYRKDGAPTGEVLEEKHISSGQTRDAMGEYDPKKGTLSGATYAPWYSQPKFLNDVNKETDVNFKDKPAFSLPVKSGEGKLTEVKGQDRFALSLAAKRDATVIHLKSTNWEVPWNVSVSAALTGKGGEVSSEQAKEPPPTPDPNKPIAILSAQEWSAFDSVEKAMAAPTGVLLQSLPGAKAQSQDAYNNIVEALRRKNPALSVTVTVVSKNSIVFDDRITVRITGTKTAQRGSTVIGEGASATFSFGLNDVVDPASIDGGTSLTVEILEGKLYNSTEATGRLSFPFAGPITLRKSGSARYEAAASI